MTGSSTSTKPPFAVTGQEEEVDVCVTKSLAMNDSPNVAVMVGGSVAGVVGLGLLVGVIILMRRRRPVSGGNNQNKATTTANRIPPPLAQAEPEESTIPMAVSTIGDPIPVPTAPESITPTSKNDFSC